MPSRPLETGTFSIVARCAETGALGAAVATAIPGAGAICPFVGPSGALSTQSFNNYAFGVDGLRYLAEGVAASDVGPALLRGDPGRERRQLLIVDASGGAWAFTGQECRTARGHRTGAGYAVAGNMLATESVLSAMAERFEASAAPGATLAERLMQVLEAGQEAGGDKRGKQSAALKTLRPGRLVPLCDLRVDEHADPVRELRRVYEVAKRQLLPFMESMPDRLRAEDALSEKDAALLEKAPGERR